MLDAQQFLYKNLFSFWPDEFASFTQITIDKYVEIVTNKYFTEEDIFNACQMLTRGRHDRNNDFMPKAATLSLRMIEAREYRFKEEATAKRFATPRLTGQTASSKDGNSEEKKKSNEFIRAMTDAVIAEGKSWMEANDPMSTADKEKKAREDAESQIILRAYEGDQLALEEVRAKNRSIKLSDSFKAYLADMDAMRKAEERG